MAEVMQQNHPEYGPEDEVFVAVPDDEDPVEDEVDDSAYDMGLMADHHEMADNSAGEEEVF